jgi:pimeloyl-ACP methyl ester carboxylesterase
VTKIIRKFVDTEFGQMHCRMAGEASDKNTLICLHQSPKSTREFIPFIKIAANDRRVVGVDNLGHGESDVPDGPVGIEGYARAVWAVIDALDLGRVDLVGYHTGTKVAAEMAWQRPDNVGRIVMISALVTTEKERDAFKSDFQPVPLDEAGTRFTRIWERSLHYRGPGVTLEMLASSLAESVRAGDAYKWGHDAAFEYSEVFPERLASLPHPVTVLNPKDMLFDYTNRVRPYVKNGVVIDHLEWGGGFLETDPSGAVAAVKAAL